jgi:hypothetical protein
MVFKCGIQIVKFHCILFLNRLFHLAYDIINGSIELIYRVDQFYGLGYLLRRSFYEKSIKDSFKDCCSKRYEENSFVLLNSFFFIEFGINGRFRKQHHF